VRGHDKLPPPAPVNVPLSFAITFLIVNGDCVLLKVLDLTRPLDKRVYRGTLPTCHDFNITTASLDRVLLVIGFSAGQIQLIDPISKELSRLYNEEVGSTAL